MGENLRRALTRAFKHREDEAYQQVEIPPLLDMCREGELLRAYRCRWTTDRRLAAGQEVILLLKAGEVLVLAGVVAVGVVDDPCGSEVVALLSAPIMHNLANGIIDSVSGLEWFTVTLQEGEG